MKRDELLSDMALAFVTADGFDDQLESALRAIGEFLKVSRTYVFLDDPDGERTSCTHEWCADGVSPQIANLQDIPYEAIPSWRRTMLEKGRIVADEVSALSSDLREILEPQGILSLLVYPLRIDNALRGFIGFDECARARKWDGWELNLLKTASGIISVVYERKLALERMRSSEENFRSFFDTVDELIVVGDLKGRILHVNDAVVRRLGHSVVELRGKSILCLHPEDGRDAAGKVLEAMLRREICQSPQELSASDGTRIPVETRVWFGRWNGRESIFGLFEDVTEQARLREQLDAKRQRLRNVIEGTRLGTWEWNVQTGETAFNDRWAEIVGYTLAELEPVSIRTWIGLAHPDDLLTSERLLQRHFDGELDYYEFEARMRHRDGRWVWVLDRGKVIERDAAGAPLWMFGTHTDITEKKEMEERIRQISIRDPLTEVYDRRYIFGRLEELVAECSRGGRDFCVAILDIDHFKSVNDRYGHQAGDFVLKEFTSIIGSYIRSYDLLGRYGGEEFVIVFPGTEKEEAASVIARIMGGVRARAFLHGGNEIRLTFSAGVSDSSEIEPAARLSVEAMVEVADRRLYAAKEGGRDLLVSC